MKFKTTQKAIKANYNTIICVPYCGLQNLLNYESPIAYTVRREGWGADIYDMGGGVAIVTGYAPFGNVRPSYELQERYETGAEKIRAYYNFDYEKCKARLRGAIREFIEAVVKRSTGARYSIPGKGRHFSGCMGIGFHLMNVLEWGFNYELHFQNNGNNERIQQQKVVY